MMNNNRLNTWMAVEHFLSFVMDFTMVQGTAIENTTFNILIEKVVHFIPIPFLLSFYFHFIFSLYLFSFLRV